MASQSVPSPSTGPTGPRTAEGKARSSQNARKHGFSASSLAVLPGEQAEFDFYQNELLHQIKPQPGLQADLFRQLVHAGWSLARLENYELQILEQGNPFDSPEAQVKLDRLERYRTAHRRAYSRILAEIRKLQTDVMLWTMTHGTLCQVRDAAFPLANPSAHLGRRLRELSSELSAAQMESLDETTDSTPVASFCKTNSRPSGNNPVSDLNI